ncbi:THAP domain-containing protein 2-like isoform X2 [Plodia interpunctella]|uniref:THAP domain-containing protein 2-like isoform X2 n=1 Tax=Plodia interpunctella TaxID=58824 RepID=UPI002367AB6A|nr:THAP domain-containing protein 2-like isoform X2 [Plodia interpunctella]
MGLLFIGRFPRDTERRRQWEVAVNREQEWAATSSSTVCSEHFLATDFYLTDNGLRRLIINAVPAINISVCQVPEPTISKLPPIDINPADTEEVIQLKHKVRRLEIIAEDRKRRLNLMWQRKKRLRKKLHRMKCLLKHLVEVKKAKEVES